MKKLFTAALLSILTTVSASAIDFSIVGRVDYPLDYNLYTFLDGDIGEHVSYSFSNHWVSKDTKALYQNTWRSWDVNWCDWANFTITFGGLSITVGKDLLLTGSNEEMPNDVDNYAFLCSEFWNNLQMYQWGGKIAYEFSDINTTFEAQYCSSPFNEKPFLKNGAFSFGISGEYGIYQPHFTANMIGYDPMEYEIETVSSNKFWILTLGNLFTVTDDFSLALDYILCPNKPVSVSNHLAFTGDWRCLDHLGLKCKAGYEWFDSDMEEDLLLEFSPKHWFAGLICEFYPLKSDDLRIHAGGGYSQGTKNYFNIGITYNFNVTNLFRK